MNQDVINYIKEARQHGLPNLEIKQNLLDAGWEAQTVEDSFSHLKAESTRPIANLDEDITSKASDKPPTPAEPTAVLNPSVSPQSQAVKPWYKRLVLPIAIVAVAVFAGGGFLLYQFVYASPERIWGKFTQLTGQKIVSSNFKFSYFDKGDAVSEDLMALPFKDIKLELEGKAYADRSGERNPQSNSELAYTFTSGNTKFSTGFEYKLIDKKIYMNVGSNPFLESAFTALGKGKKIEWIVLNLEELEKKAGEQSNQDFTKFKEVFNTRYVEELKKIWEDAIFVKMDKYLGRENVDDKSTLHFSNSLDKEAIKNTLMAIMDKIIKSIKDTGQEIKDEDVNSAKMVINALVDKLEIKTFETWIGLKDFRLYKSKIVFKAPSVVSAIKTLAMDSAQEKSRDAKRLADMRQMASALELYFNDNGRYPASNKGIPQDIDPKYMTITIAPVPSDGNCTDYYNTYWYELLKDNNQSYEMTFCLGKDTGGYKSGILKLTPNGIVNLEVCPSTPENCYKNASAEGQVQATEPETSREGKIRDTINKISFDGEISLEANYSDYGVKKEVKAPEGAFDLIELIEPKQLPVKIVP